MKLCERFRGRTIACLATGPSFTARQVEIARAKGFVLFGCNKVWEVVPDLALLYACNEGFWAHYWSDALAAYPAEKWTTNDVAAKKFGLNWIAERDAPGLSTDPSYVHHGHGSGYTMLNLAFLLGAARIVLVGYDLRYAPNYNGKERKPGSSPRHFFGEYPSALQHWPSFSVKDGVHVEMVALYETVARQDIVPIVNCSMDSALTCFPRMAIDDV